MCLRVEDTKTKLRQSWQYQVPTMMCSPLVGVYPRKTKSPHTVFATPYETNYFKVERKGKAVAGKGQCQDRKQGLPAFIQSLVAVLTHQETPFSFCNLKNA